MNYKLLTITFCVTAIWDVILRYMSYSQDKLPNIVLRVLPFLKVMPEYFDRHTLLAAALIAGFVGAVTQIIITQFIQFPKKSSSYRYVLYFLFISFVISALFGFVMKGSQLFPHLDETYYKYLGTVRSMYHDGISGLIVQCTIILMIYGNIIKN